jgi:hypothetical protein
MVALTLNTTKLCDVSKTTLYRANYPTIYARVNDLDFIAYIANQGYWWSFRYILNHAKHARKMLKNKTKAQKPIPFKPSL